MDRGKIYQLTVEDYKSALNGLSDDEKAIIENIHEECIINSLKKDLYIPDSEYIAEHIRSRFIY